MALKPLNSVGGFSVGEIPANVIASNAYITSNGALFSGNLAISNANANWGILTDNLYYSNGIPWDFQLPGGSNTQIQFNNNGEFGGSANFTFDTATNLLTVTGNANITGTLNAGSINTSGIANGTSNLSIPAVNGNVNISSAGNANILVVTGTGVNVSGTLHSTGNLTALNASLGNLATANYVNVSNNLNVSLELAGNTANFSGNVVTNNLVANGVANVGNLNVVANVTSDLLPNANLTLDLGSSTQRWDNIYAGNIDASGNLTIAGNLSSNNYTANIITANTLVNIGNTQIRHGEVTTTSASPGQTISTVAVSGITGIEWIVKGIDITGSKYSIDIVTAVTNGSSVDYSVFGGVNLGTTTGSLAVNIVGSNIDLQVTPSSSNSTVWITQYRTI